MSPFFFKLNLLSINSHSVFVFFWGGEGFTSRCWRKGGYIRWHPSAVRKPSRLSISNRHNPSSGCENLQEQTEEECDVGAWEGPRGKYVVWRTVLWAGGAYQSWGALEFMGCRWVTYLGDASTQSRTQCGFDKKSKKSERMKGRKWLWFISLGQGCEFCSSLCSITGSGLRIPGIS